MKFDDVEKAGCWTGGWELGTARDPALYDSEVPEHSWKFSHPKAFMAGWEAGRAFRNGLMKDTEERARRIYMETTKGRANDND